jgi:phosphatidylinositol 3-kinase
MYLLQLVQALKYENFDDIKNGLEPTKKDSQTSASESLSNSGVSSGDIDRYGLPGKIIYNVTISPFSC